jgi:hypothetical protein
MRLGARAFVLFLTMGSVVACSELPPPDPLPPIVTLGCTNDVNSAVSIMDWELEVSTEPIESDQPFTRTLGGTAVFDEDFLDAAQDFISGGVEEVNLVDLRVTVHVRSGATGDDVVLNAERIPYKCDERRTACDPMHDVVNPDDPFDAPGLRANTDCEPVGKANPCGRFISAPISVDCEPSGVCAGLGKAAQCRKNGFCIIGDLRVPLQKGPGQYIAASEGNVLFGWDDKKTGATEVRDPDDPNYGTWILPEPVYEELTGPNGLRVTVRGVRVALECTMGVDCKDPLLGSGCFHLLSSPTPDSALIPLPIQTEAF